MNLPHLMAIFAGGALVPGDGFELRRAMDDLRCIRVVTHAQGTHADGTSAGIHGEVRISSEGSLYFDYAHGDVESWTSDPNRARLFLHNGVVVQEILFRRVAVEFPIEQMTKNETLEHQPIWAVLGWWPAGFPIACPSVHGVEARLPADLAGFDVSESEDTVIVQNSQQRIELSRSHGLAVSRRSWDFQMSGQPRTSMVVDSFLEVAPGVWFPRDFRVERHNPDNASEVRTVAYRVLEASIDGLEPSEFQFQPPPGTYLLNASGDGGGRQLVAGGFDLMEEYVALVKTMRTSYGAPWSVLALGSLVGCIVYLLASWIVRHRLP